MKRLFLFSILIALCIGTNAQLKPLSPTRPTPNAASLGVFGETPVSYYTGVPSIDIPLYTINAGFTSLPISISYHAGGFRPEAQPGWVGRDWALVAGGSISRKVNHYPDEYNYANSTINVGGQGFFYSHYFLDTSSWAYPATQQIGDGLYRDREPDEFSFSFLGYSGKFYLNHKGEWRVQSDQPLKVIFDTTDFAIPFIYGNCNCEYQITRKTFGRFTIVDENGIRYVFGSNDAIDYSIGAAAKNVAEIPDYDYASNAISTNWYLTEILPPAGYPVILSYERGPYQITFSYYEFQTNCSVGENGTGFLQRSGVDGRHAHGITGNITSPVYLTKIEAQGGNVAVDFYTSKAITLGFDWETTYKDVLRDDYGTLPTALGGYLGFNMNHNIPYFTRNPSDSTPSPTDMSTKFFWLKLDSINVRYNNSIASHDYPSFGYIKREQVKFHYYENSTKRLRLDSVELTALNAGNPRMYRFKYNTSTLPGYVSDLTDHWGFANGNDIVRNSSSDVYSYIPETYNYRQPLVNESLKGLIDEIQYPTGGKAKFYFENNKCYGYASRSSNGGGTQIVSDNDTLLGGARVQRIEWYDALGNKSAREYHYVMDYNPETNTGTQSSGILDAKPDYRWSYIDEEENIVYVYNSTPIVPVSSASSGTHVGYVKVTERFDDGSYKTYTFTNYQYGYTDDDPVYVFSPNLIPAIPFSRTDFERGKLLYEETYSANGVLVAKKEYAYQQIGYNSSNFIRTVKLDYSGWCDVVHGDPSGFPAMTAYYNYTYSFLPNRVRDYQYDANGNYVMAETESTYDSIGNVKTQKVYQSDSALRETRYTYAYNNSGAVYDSMVTRNMIGLPITIDTYVDNVLVEGVKNNYSFFNDSSLIAVSYVQYKKGSEAYETKFRYNAYDEKGNVLEIQRDNDLRESFLYGYYNRWPVAKVTGKSYADVVALVDTSVVNWPDGNAELESELADLRTALPEAMVTTYSYSDQGQMLSQTDPSGKKVNYEYDNNGRLQRVRDEHNYITQSFDYRYNLEAEFPYKNTLQKDTLYPSGGCPTGYASDGVIYSVAANKYGSFISVADANSKAWDEITEEGQAYADANATCYPYYSFAPCCTWGTAYNDFVLNGNGTVTFSIVFYKSGSQTAYGSMGYLSGSLFLPSSTQTLSISSGGSSYTLFIYTSGEFYIYGSSFSGYLELSGTYSL